MYFSQNGDTIECLITGRQWNLPSPGTAGYTVEKQRVINAAKDYQARVLEKLRHVMSQHFYTLEGLSAAAAKLA